MRSILVAEDSFALGNLLTFVLKNAGFDVDLHRSGSSAYTSACTTKYDLILVDQQMPHMTGCELIEAIRIEGPNRETPVFLCTAKSHELALSDIQERLRVVHVFHKPFSPKELVKYLNTVAPPVDAVS